MGIQETFAANVRKFRKMAGLTQESLAELSGLHRTYIGGIEQRRVNVSLKNIGKIANALGVDPAVLFLTEGAPEKLARAGSADRSPASAENADAAASADAPESAGDAGDQASSVDEAPGGKRAAEYALCAWHNGKLTMSPIEVEREDVTVQILCELVASGYVGNDLVKRYAEVCREVMSFLRNGNTPRPNA